MTIRPALLLILGALALPVLAQHPKQVLAARYARLPVGGGVFTLDGAEGPFAFNITQNTCALYVAVRSSSLEAPVAFGEDLEERMVRWNLCPWTEVACQPPTATRRDSTRAGVR